MTSGAQQVDVPAAPAPATSVGDVLRGARLGQQLTLEQLSTELRIETRQLLALEENRFEQIGVPVFVKGYLRQYGHRLGLDVGELLERYHEQTHLAEIQIQPSRTIKLHDERQVTFWVLAVVVLFAVIVGVAVWWWDDGAFGLSLTGVTTTPSPVTEAPAAGASAASAVAAASFAPASVSPATSAAPPPPADDAAAASIVPAADSPSALAPASADSPTTDGAAASAAAPSSDASAAPAANGESPATALPTAQALPLVLTFSSESWTEVTDARGERLFYGLGAAGQRVNALGEPPFTVVLGNADAVQLLLDGTPYPVPTEGRQGNLARFTVDVAEE